MKQDFLGLDEQRFKDAFVVLDIDGTLTHDKGDVADRAVLEKIEALSRVSSVYLCSNGDPERTRRIADTANVSLVATRYRKPNPRILHDVSLEGKRVVVIGDKVLTDGLLARSLNSEFVHVSRVRHESDGTAVRLSYLVDDLVGGLALGLYPITPYLKLLRPTQWIKNGLVFAPLFFAGSLFSPPSFFAALLAFCAFSLAASGVYILNDTLDRNQDRQHPSKRYRPMASGQIGRMGAIALLGLICLMLFLLLMAAPALASVIAIYVLLNGAYSVWLKHIAVIDILCVASCYILRILAGSVATGIVLSPWIILCVFFGALFVVVGKRRAEHRHDVRRRVMEQYSEKALDFMLASSAALAVISYSVYTILGQDLPYLVYSTAFVVLAFFRVLNKIYTHPNDAEAPERMLFTDAITFGTFIAWWLFILFAFYSGV